MTGLRVPSATYRVQLNRRFGFADARALVPYLYQLGITDLYASPIFKARRGSSHGYDVTDPTRLNPELGTEAEFEALVQELKRHGMGLLLDIVPNHMAASSENAWWVDVLENGPSSPYASYFDIDWHPDPTGGVPQGTVLLPILGSPYRGALENHELILALDEEGFFVRYHALRLPLDPSSYHVLLTYRLENLEETLGQRARALHELENLIEAIRLLPARTAADGGAVEARRREEEIIKQRLWDLYNAHPEIRRLIDENVALFSQGAKDARGSYLLDQLLADQAYRLAFWREGAQKINYRRFFDINDLIGIRVEDPGVFETTHSLISRLADEGKVTGLRVDHIDGLYDPLDYLRRLQARLGTGEAGEASASFYVVVEKILGGDEELPPEWPVCGTTGYDFLNSVNAVFVDARGLGALDRTYQRFTKSRLGFGDVVYENKKRLIQDLFAGELGVLRHHLSQLTQDDPSCEQNLQELTRAIVEVTACLPVYRTYVRGFEVTPQDRSYIEEAVSEVRRRNRSVSASALDFVRRVLLLDFPASSRPQQREQGRRFVTRWQQFSGAVMAKGLEDTSLYVHNPLISLNEVGGDPHWLEGHTGIDEFHRSNQSRFQHWPHTLNATSTHDTKRSEDVRARINVLSELPRTWVRCLNRWSRWNRKNRRMVNGRVVPDASEEIFFYQTLLGAWPLTAEEVPEFQQRLKAYLVKAAREAKVHTSWLDPDEAHERALVDFAEACLDTSNSNEFWGDFLRFQERIAYYGAINSLAQVMLKIASPGVPDFYQGTELWDFSLVDPDNRRPVDFARRAEFLGELEDQATSNQDRLVRDLSARWQDGRSKLYLIAKALDFRQSHADLFQKGDYIPLSVSGERQEHVVAFARRDGNVWALVAVPRLVARLSAAGRPPVGRRTWKDSALSLPARAPRRWVNVLTGETVDASSRLGSRVIGLGDIFRSFPVALLSGPVSGGSD